MSRLSVFTKPTEKEIKSLKWKIFFNRNILKEVDIGGSSLLQIAIIHNDINFSRFLINKGIDVNHRDEKGDTALHYCAEYTRYDIAKYVLEHGGRLDISDKHGNEPLWTAAFNFKKDDGRITELYLKHGANKHHKNRVNKSPLDMASDFSSYPIKTLFDSY